MSEPYPGSAEVKGHVLIVEDEAVVGIFLRIVLAEAGIHATVFHSAQPALEAARAVVFSAAIVDVGLPGMPGDELARQLRVLHPRLPIILATGYDMNAFAPMLRDQLVRVLEKPFDEPQLFEQLRALHQTTV